MTEEEIKKIAKEYAEAMCPVGDYCGGVYDDQRNSDLPIHKDDAKSVLKWLCKDYCIVPKSKVRENYQSLKQDIPNFKDNPEHHCGFFGGMTELELLFGKSLFEEEK